MCIRYWTRADDYIAGIVGGALVVALAFVGLSTARTLNPMSKRYELLSVAVATPTKLGSPIEVSVLRRIHKNFRGHYVTTVRQIDEVAPVCNGGLEVPYRAMTPEQLAGEPRAMIVTLDWWTEGARPPCQEAVDRLSPGQFVLTTCIYDDTGGLINAFWPRFVCRDSNLFEVIE